MEVSFYCQCPFTGLQTLNLNRTVKTTNYTVEDLEPDVEYEFRVSAENNIGTSEPAVSNPLKYGQSAKIFTVSSFQLGRAVCAALKT